MENKYFTPELEELCVGYICEVKNSSDDKYFDWEYQLIEKSDLIYISNWLDWGEVRTKYLDEDDLKKEGWINEGNLFFKLELDTTDRWYLSFYPENNRVEFCDQENENGFAGTIKSINEFRNIIKYLEI